MLKGILRKCRKHYLEMFSEFKGLKNIVMKNVTPTDLREFSETMFDTIEEKQGLDIVLAALIFN